MTGMCEHLHREQRRPWGDFCTDCGEQVSWSGVSFIDERKIKNHRRINGWCHVCGGTGIEDIPHEDVTEPTYNLDRAYRVLRPGVTVAIACHPARIRGGLLQRALNSVTTQTLQPAAIVMVNDSEKKGAGWTRRQCLDLVHTEWVAWLDSDDEWLSEHLEKLMRVAVETDSVWVFSWFNGRDPLGHFGRPFDPCHPHHTTMGVLERTEIAKEAGFPDSVPGRFSNEDWAHITAFAKICCERGLKMTHLAERTWHYHQGHGNTSGQPGQGDAR